MTTSVIKSNANITVHAPLWQRMGDEVCDVSAGGSLARGRGIPAGARPPVERVRACVGEFTRQHVTLRMPVTGLQLRAEGASRWISTRRLLIRCWLVCSASRSLTLRSCSSVRELLIDHGVSY